MTGVPSPAFAEWIESFAPGSVRKNGSVVVHAGADSYELVPLEDGRWAAGFRERGRLYLRMRARRDFAERYFVWFTAEASRRGGGDATLAAPWRIPAEGPLRLRGGGERSTEVLDGEEVVATFDHPLAHGGDGIEFTHYGFLPVEVLIAQLSGPDDELVFPIGTRFRSEEEQLADARRIRVGTTRLLAGYDQALPSRIVGPPEVRRRLHLFRYVHALPKDGGGDSLQIALRVADGAAGRGLLAMLGLDGPATLGGVQHPVGGPFAGTAVTGEIVSSSMTPTADILHAWLVRIRLWNETATHADLYEVTAGLVDQAVAIEAALVHLGLDRHPREIGLLGFDRSG